MAMTFDHHHHRVARAVKSPSLHWSARRTLIFLIVSSGLLWVGVGYVAVHLIR